MITDPQHALALGSLSLVSNPTDLTDPFIGFVLEAEGDDATWGNPRPIVQAVESWLLDGALKSVTGWENRELFLRVRVRGVDGRALVRAEGAIRAELGRLNTLTWTPPDGVGSPTVFELTEDSWFDHDFVDMNELRLTREFGLRLVALPWVRSSKLTVATVPAPSTPAPTVTVIDACNSVSADWQVWPGNILSAAVGSVRSAETIPADTLNAIVLLSRINLSQSMATSPYLRIEFALMPNGATLRETRWRINGVTTTPVAAGPTTAWFDCTGMTLTSVELRAVMDNPGAGSVAAWVEFADISRSTAPRDGAATGRQSSRIIPVAGSMRTPGSLTIASTTAGLGDAIIFTRPAVDGMATPDLQAKRTTGPAATIDATTVSGVRTALATQHEFTIAASAVPEAGHLLVARIRASSTVSRTLTWATRWKMGGTTSADIETGTTTVALTANVWATFIIGRMLLPPRRMGPSGSVLIRLIANAATDLDEAWAFDVENGYLSISSCGAGSPASGSVASRWWYDSPSISNDGIPGMWAGTQADRSDALAVADDAQAGDLHEFTPPAQALHLVTPGATDASASLSHYARFPHHVLDLPTIPVG